MSVIQKSTDEYRVGVSQARPFAPACVPPACWSQPGSLQIPCGAGGRQRPGRWDGEAARNGVRVPSPSKQQLVGNTSPEAAARTSATALSTVSLASAPLLVLQCVTSFILPLGLAPASPDHPGPAGKVLLWLFAFIYWRSTELR